MLAYYSQLQIKFFYQHRKRRKRLQHNLSAVSFLPIDLYVRHIADPER